MNSSRLCPLNPFCALVGWGYYGLLLGCALSFGYLKCDQVITPDFVLNGKYTIDFAGKQYPAKAMLQAPFDSKNEKIMV